MKIAAAIWLLIGVGLVVANANFGHPLKGGGLILGIGLWLLVLVGMEDLYDKDL